MQFADAAAVGAISRPSVDGHASAPGSWTSSGRPSFSLRRQKSNDFHHSVFGRTKSNATMMSLEAYEALPPSIQKKYFSSTERLHIAQQSAVARRRKHSLGSASWKSGSTSTDRDMRPSTSQGISMRKRPSHRKSKETSDGLTGFPGLDTEEISQEQARWFVNLPDKVRKQQFSRKEQISLAVRCKRALQTTSPELAEDILRRCLYVGRDGDTATIGSRRRTSSATVDTDILMDDNYPEGETETRNSIDRLALEMEIYNLCSPTSPVSTRSGAGVPPIPALPPYSPTSHKQPRRSLSSRSITLMPVSLPPPQLSPVPPVPPLPSTDHLQSAMLKDGSSTLQSNGPASPSHESSTEAKHYQQPDVRKQLRQYLLPHKFDEAIEFGFALSNEDDLHSTAATTQSFPVRLPPPPTLIEDDYADEESDASPETMSPRTPTTVSDAPHPVIKKSSFDWSIETRPSLFGALKSKKTRNPQGSLGGREMTIHMTLTRRDLRGPEEDVYGVQRPQTSGVDVERVDPLALEGLQICEDPSGAHGAFAVRDGKGSNAFKKVWKTLRRQ